MEEKIIVLSRGSGISLSKLYIFPLDDMDYLFIN